MKLKDLVIVVTGSTRGIGKAIARACLEEGANVVISSRKETAVSKVCKEFKKEGYSVSGTKADVSKNRDLEKLFEHSIKKWKKIDIWINNAGLSGGFRAVDEMSPEEIAGIIDVNITGTLNACRMMIPYFIKQGSGIILNMSGRGGRFEPAPFLTVYAASKAAVTSLTKSLAGENKEYPISIHSLIPGMVETEFYTNIKTGSKSDFNISSLKYVLNAFGVPLEEVGRSTVDILTQQSGRITGKSYSLLKGMRLVRGIGLMMYYRMTKKISS